MSGPCEITSLLAEWSDRNDAALDHLVAIMYDEPHRLASNYMRGERPGHLLQTTALVHEAYLRLIDREHVSCQTRTQFFAVAARCVASYSSFQKMACFSSQLGGSTHLWEIRAKVEFLTGDRVLNMTLLLLGWISE